MKKWTDAGYLNPNGVYRETLALEALHGLQKIICVYSVFVRFESENID